MKIYPGNHTIVQTDSVNKDTDLPLAYIDTEYQSYATNIVPHLSTNKKNIIVPYSEFSSLNTGFYDSNRNAVDNTNLLQRDGSKYYYIPANATSFSPERFNYSIIGKKKMVYKTNTQYNLKISCVDNDTLDLSRQLIRVFGDAPDRQICPSNILVNSKDISSSSLINSSIKENDFVFIRSTDGIHYEDGTTIIDYDSFLDKHTNVWVSITNFPYALTATSTKSDVALKNPILYSNPPMMDYVFDTTSLIQETGVTYHNIFNTSFAGAVIKEIPNKGFVIMTPSDFIVNVVTNIKLLYEIIMYVYLNTYIESDTINDWITDVIPDYVVSNGTLTKKARFASSAEFYNLLELALEEVDLVDVEITPDNIKFSGIVNNYVTFTKEYTGGNEKYADPLKPAGSISVYTPRQNVIYYKNFVYTIEDAIQDKMECSINEDILTVIIDPFISSSNSICVASAMNLTFSLYETVSYKQRKITEGIIYLICKENILSLVNKNTYTDTDGIIIAEIQISQSENGSKVYDMRQRGGGYAIDAKPPTQSLLDVGNISGMAYRKASTLIITLPKRLEQYEDLIAKAINKHKEAEDFPIILFEDKEE